VQETVVQAELTKRVHIHVLRYSVATKLLAGRTAVMRNPAFAFDHIHIIS
jgi:site-specific recombinase XerD